MVSSAGGGDQTLVLVQIKCARMDAKEVGGRTDDVRDECGKFARSGPLELLACEGLVEQPQQAGRSSPAGRAKVSGSFPPARKLPF